MQPEISTQLSQEEDIKRVMNTHVLNKFLLDAFQEYNMPFWGKVKKSTPIKWMAIALITLVLLGIFFNFIFLGFSLFPFVFLIIISIITVITDIDDYLDSELSKKLDITNSSNISSLEGFLVLIETIQNSDYEDCLKNVDVDELYKITRKGRINDEESRTIRKNYWMLLKSIILFFSNTHGVYSNGIAIDEKPTRGVHSLKQEILKRQENFIKNNFQNGK